MTMIFRNNGGSCLQMKQNLVSLTDLVLFFWFFTWLIQTSVIDPVIVWTIPSTHGQTFKPADESFLLQRSTVAQTDPWWWQGTAPRRQWTAWGLLNGSGQQARNGSLMARYGALTTMSGATAPRWWGAAPRRQWAAALHGEGQRGGSLMVRCTAPRSYHTLARYARRPPPLSPNTMLTTW